MDIIDFPQELDRIRTYDIPEIFELVKKAVKKVTGAQRSGMMLGLADLGEGENYWIGGFHILSSNAIVMNTRSLDYIRENHLRLYKPYVFEVMMHEYLHTLGLVNEKQCRDQALVIAEQLFGYSHLVTELSRDISKFLPYIRREKYGWNPPRDFSIKYLRGFDRSSTETYIS